MADNLGLALIGAGYWGKKLAYEYLELTKRRDDISFRFIVDADKERLRIVANGLRLPRRMLKTDINEVLKDPSVGAVHVALPNKLHYSIGIQALESRKHVLLEKPMALTARDAQKLARTAERQSLVLHIGHIFRFNNAITMAKKLLDQGIIGRPFHCSLDWKALIVPPIGTDIIFDLAPHPIDILNYLSNDWPSSLLTIGKSFLRKEAFREEVAETVAEFEDGRLAHIALSWLYAGPKKRLLSVTGRDGSLEVDTLEQHLRIYKEKSCRHYPVERNNTILSMITHFINGVLGDEQSQFNAAVGVMTVAVLCSMRESMSKKQFVNVPTSQMV